MSVQMSTRVFIQLCLQWLYGTIDGACGWGCHKADIRKLGRYLVSKKKQLFNHPQALKQWKGSFKRPTSYERKKMAKKCIEDFKKQPFGKVAWKAANGLRPIIRRHAMNCAMDRINSKNKKLPKKFNRKAMQAQVCNAVKGQLRTQRAQFGDVKQAFCKIIQLCNKAKLMNELPRTCKGKNAVSNDKVNGKVKKGAEFIKKYDKRVPLCLKIKDMTDTREKVEAECWKLDYCTGYTWGHSNKVAGTTSSRQKATLMNCGKQSDKAWVVWWRRWKAKMLSGKKHAHNNAGNRRAHHANTRSRTCTCSNDIHCKPFLGNWFDIHHVASWTVAKDSGGELQIKTFRCSTIPSGWTGGLGIACVGGSGKSGNPRNFRLSGAYRGAAQRGSLTVSLTGDMKKITGVCGGHVLWK